MPNIIEQQDLLKGLPDNRLAMMMQNPSGDIPPFLVAAEAQRRQAIRAQFSGGPQESVVDTLTKQMANVPQNIQAPAQMPPRMPPPQMPQSGVAGIQQGMRDGGMVQRYDVGGGVQPWWKIPNYGSVVPRVVDYVGSGLGSLYEFATTPYSEMKPPEEAPVEAAPTSASVSAYNPLSSIRVPTQKTLTASPTFDPRDPSAGKKETSINNQAKTDMTVDEYKKYLEDIYGVRAEDSEYIRNKIKEMYSGEERSGWERAQKWFAASQAAIQPGQTDMQAAINALSALGSGYAEERAADRASKRDMEEALLKQDIADRQAAGQSDRDIAKAVLDFKLAQEERDRAARSSADELQLSGLTKQSDYAIKKAEMYARMARDERDRLDSLISDMRNTMTEDEIMRNPKVQEILKRIGDINTLQQDALAESKLGMERYGEKTGSSLFFETADGVNPIRPGQ